MKIDRHARQTAKKYLRACLRPDGSINEQDAREIVNLLVTQKPRNYIAILSRLQKLLEMALEDRAVVVESATALADQGASVISSLEARYGKASSTAYRVTPSLLGGLRVRRGSNIWDGSLSARLERLNLAFS